VGTGGNRWVELVADRNGPGTRNESDTPTVQDGDIQESEEDETLMCIRTLIYKQFMHR
jgi:hypothetical protein